MLFQRWVQMGFSSPEVSCEVCELTRLWMLCRVDPRGLVRLSCLGSCWTHPRRSPSLICPFVVLDPTDLGATIVVAPGQMPCNFLPSSDADHLPFWAKLVPCTYMSQTCMYTLCTVPIDSSLHTCYVQIWKIMNMYIHVHTFLKMYVHVCTWYVHGMYKASYKRVCTSFRHVCTSL